MVTNKAVSMQELKPGQMGVIVDSKNPSKGRIVIRCYDRIRLYEGYTPVFQILGMNDCYSGSECSILVRPLPLTSNFKIEENR